MKQRTYDSPGQLTEDTRLSELDEGIEELSSELDAKFGQNWHVWRTALGRWCFRGHLDGQVCEPVTHGLASCLWQAARWKPLPVVPREPKVYTQSLFKPYKNGSKWRLLYDRTDCGVQFSTKRETLKYAEKCVHSSEVARMDWMDEYAWTGFKSEGIDFRYEC